MEPVSIETENSIIGESKHEIEVMEKEEEDIEDWSSDDRNDMEWLDVTLGYSGQYWWSREYDQTPCLCRRGWCNLGVEGIWFSWYGLDIILDSMMWCLSEGVVNVEKEGEGEGSNEGENCRDLISTSIR